MNRWPQTSLLLFVTFLLYGCIEDIDLSELPTQERLVVISTNLVDRPWSFIVSKSYASSNINYNREEDAIIKLYGSSGLLEIIEFRPDLNRYQSILAPSSFQNYWVSIEAPGMETVTATTYAPSQVISSATSGVEILSSTKTYLEIDLSISDLLSEKNYYVVNGYSKINKLDGSDSYKFVGTLKVNDSNAENQYISTSSFDTFRYLFVDDATASLPFFSENLELKFFLDITNTAVLRGTYDYESQNQVYIIVFSVSESLYEYLYSSDQYLYSNGSSATNLEGSSVIIQTNIEDGLGVFGAFTSDTIQVR